MKRTRSHICPDPRRNNIRITQKDATTDGVMEVQDMPQDRNPPNVKYSLIHQNTQVHNTMPVTPTSRDQVSMKDPHMDRSHTGIPMDGAKIQPINEIREKYRSSCLGGTRNLHRSVNRSEPLHATGN